MQEPSSVRVLERKPYITFITFNFRVGSYKMEKTANASAQRN